MATLLLFVALMFQGQVVTQGGPPPAPVPKDAPKTLPDTPQGKHVKAYIDAFNSGDEKKFLAAQEELMAAGDARRRPAAERAKMFSRMKGDFGTLTVKRAACDAGQDPRRHGRQGRQRRHLLVRVRGEGAVQDQGHRRRHRQRRAVGTSAWTSRARQVSLRVMHSDSAGLACAVFLVPRSSASGATAQARSGAIPPLRVSDNKRFLVTADGRPFFWLGDTAWELFHRLTREDAVRYLDNRARLRFTVDPGRRARGVRRPRPAERVRPSASPQQRSGDP